MTEPDKLRVSDDDRHKVAEVLRRAAGEGRLDLEELDERLEAAYAAKTYGDLVPVLADLPGSELDLPRTAQPARPTQPAVPVPGGAPTHETSTAVMSEKRRTGVWAVGPTHTAFALMGGVTLDLREAVFDSSEVVITANAIMAGIEIIVNAHTHVVVDGTGIMGGFEQGKDKVQPTLDARSPTVRVTGVALMAGVQVQRKPMPGEGRRGMRRMLGH